MGLGHQQVHRFIVSRHQSNFLYVGSITSRCSEKEPALGGWTRHERAAEIKPSLYVVGTSCTSCTTRSGEFLTNFDLN